MDSLARHWSLDPDVVFLNHGSFGATPRVVQAAQARWREELERQPVHFFLRRWEDELAASREALAGFLGAREQDLVFVPNATTGVNTVLRSLDLGAGDEIVVTDHGYNACTNAARLATARGARLVTARVPFPGVTPDAVVQAVLDVLSPATKLVLIDHVTSPTGLVLPVERLAPLLAERGVDLLVDGAHAPGMVPLDLAALDVPYYTGNCHKWICAPKGAAFLHVREDRQDRVRPLVTSHGANSPRTDRSAFQLTFLWPGTHDPTAFLCVKDALATMGGLLEGGWDAVRAANHALVVEGRRLVLAALGLEPPAPESMLGSLAAVPLPPGDPTPRSPLDPDPLWRRLWEEHRIEVPVFPWPEPPRRLLRISAQLHNEREDYQALAEVLPGLVAETSAAETRPGGVTP